MSRELRKLVCTFLAFVMIAAPPAAYAQPPADAVDGASTIDLKYVTPETVAAVVAHPRRVLAAPEMEMLPIEVISAAGIQQLGFDPLEVEQVLAIAEPPQAGPPQAGAVIKFSKPQKMANVLPMLVAQTKRAELNGRVYLQGTNPMFPSLYAVDQQTLIVAHDGLLRKLLSQDGPPAAGPMSELLSGVAAPPDLLAAVVVDPLRPLIEAQLGEVPVPPPFEPLKKVPGLLSSVEAQVNLTGDLAMSLALQARDAASADELEQIIDQMLTMARQMLEKQMAGQFGGDDPVEQAMAQYMKRMNDRLLTAVRPVRKGNRLELAGSGQGQMQMATIGVLVALLLPAVNAARAAARRNQSLSNLRQMSLGLLMYQDEHGRFPTNSYDANGKPLLSWRVHILPYLEQEVLYKQFKLDEPWDSPHNSQLIAQMPVEYRNPVSTAEPGKTTYLGLVGEGTVFSVKEGLKIAQIRDGTSNTIALVEANDDKAVVWTAPQDLPFDPDNPLAGLGEAHPGGVFQAAFLDGSVRVITDDVDPTTLKAMATYDGGEPVGGF